jgi:soluble lytic murein transglycosylase-like protein
MFLVIYTNILTYTQMERSYDRELDKLSQQIVELNYKLTTSQSEVFNAKLEIHKLTNTINLMSYEHEQEMISDITEYIKIHYKRSPEISREIAINIVLASKKYSLPIQAIVAVSETESEFKPTAVSKRGARGLMQVNYEVWKGTFRINKADLHTIDQNIDIGSQILRSYLNETGQDMQQALFKYVGGDSTYYKRVYVNLAKFHIFRALNR